MWTYQGRVAFVLSVTEKGRPVSDGIKLQRLKQLVTDIMLSGGSADVIVDMGKVRGRGTGAPPAMVTPPPPPLLRLAFLHDSLFPSQAAY